jgi:hypothetical protein
LFLSELPHSGAELSSGIRPLGYSKNSFYRSILARYARAVSKRFSVISFARSVTALNIDAGAVAGDPAWNGGLGS